jgi:hypothetical protein
MRHAHALILAVGLGSPIAALAVDLLDFPGPDYRLQRELFSPPRGCFSSPLIRITPAIQFFEILPEPALNRPFKSVDPTLALPLDNPFAAPIRLFDGLMIDPPRIELKDSPVPAPKR